MDKNYFRKYVLLSQGAYTLLTALWGLLDIESFMAITGPKTDIWLVKTVSVLFIAVGISILNSFIFNPENKSTAVLCVSVSAGIAIIDFYYSFNQVIKPVYIFDGAMQVAFVLCWLRIIFTAK